ncbi:hypothetical protein Bbelb_106250 [Branchiostoma belcheri]|nr:hypothetical protein Bbelb_106250 [Branchiostoma belcheri]
MDRRNKHAVQRVRVRDLAFFLLVTWCAVPIYLAIVLRLDLKSACYKEQVGSSPEMSMLGGGLLLLVIILQSSPQVSQTLPHLNLPESHLPYFFSSHHALARTCEQDDECPYKEYLGKKVCWGYEKNCKKKNRFHNPTCTIANTGWGSARTVEENADLFWKEADFGYVWERLQEMTVMCKPKEEGDSSLSCVKHSRYCRATNIYMDFANLDSENNSNRCGHSHSDPSRETCWFRFGCLQRAAGDLVTLKFRLDYVSPPGAALVRQLKTAAVGDLTL